MTREEMIKRAGELSEQNRLKGYHCSESSFRAVAEVMGIPVNDELLKISSVFRGGGGGYGDRCGVCEAGLMLIGMLYGRESAETPDIVYSYIAQEWQRRFKLTFVSLYCRDILAVARHETPEHNCSRTYIKGAEILTELLLDAPDIVAAKPWESEEAKKIKSVSNPGVMVRMF